MITLFGIDKSGNSIYTYQGENDELEEHLKIATEIMDQRHDITSLSHCKPPTCVPASTVSALTFTYYISCVDPPLNPHPFRIQFLKTSKRFSRPMLQRVPHITHPLLAKRMTPPPLPNSILVEDKPHVP